MRLLNNALPLMLLAYCEEPSSTDSVPAFKTPSISGSPANPAFLAASLTLVELNLGLSGQPVIISTFFLVLGSVIITGFTTRLFRPASARTSQNGGYLSVSRNRRPAFS